MNLKKTTKNTSLCTLIITALTTVLLTLSFKFSFDFQNGYFVSGIFPTLFSVFYLAGIVLSFAATLTVDKNQIIKTENSIGRVQAPSIAIVAALAIAVLACNVLSDDTYLSVGNVGVAAFLVYILLCSGKSGLAKSPVKILLVYLSVIFPVAMTMGNSANYARHINSVENTLSTVFGLSFMIYILYEAKRVHDGAHSRWHLAAMLLTTHTGFSLSVSYIIAYLTKSANEPARFLQMLLTFLISALVLAELVRFTKNASSHTKEEWGEIEAPTDCADEQTDVSDEEISEQEQSKNEIE